MVLRAPSEPFAFCMLTRMYSRMHASTTHFNSCTRMLLSPARLFARARVRRRRTAVCSSCARMLLQPAHGALAMVALFRAKNGFCMHACTLRRRIAVPALACSSALRNYLLACTRTRAPPPHCSSCARMLLSPPMAHSPWLVFSPHGDAIPLKTNHVALAMVGF